MGRRETRGGRRINGMVEGKKSQEGSKKNYQEEKVECMRPFREEKGKKVLS